MTDKTSLTTLKADEQEALLYAKRVKEFYEFLTGYLACAVIFLVVFGGHPVVYIVLASVGLGLIWHGLAAFEVISFLSPDWERKLAERKLGRKLE